MERELKITHALDEANNLIDVKGATKENKYTCFGCGESLVLRDGEIKIKHFAHRSDTKCDGETVLHKVYKAVLQQEKKIRFPFGCGLDLVEFDRVELEKKVGDFVPDAIGYAGNDMYLIEFANTHFVGKRKLDKIKQLNLPALEVTCWNGTLDEVRRGLVENNHLREILHFPGMTNKEIDLTRHNEFLKGRNDELKKETEVLISEITSLKNEIEMLNYKNQTIFDKQESYWFGKNISKNGKTYYKNYELSAVAFINDRGLIIKENSYSNG